MTSPQDFQSLQGKVQAALVSATKSVNRIAAEDLAFQRAVNPGVGDGLDAQTERLLELSTTLLRSAAEVCGVVAPNVEDVEDIDITWRSIVDVVDSVLEKADTSIDEYTGALKRKDAPTADASQAKKPKTVGPEKVVRNANITKPQLNFDPPVDNYAPWKPVITKKPHGKVSLEESLAPIKSDSGFETYKHPYETEIFEAAYPDRVYKQAEPISWQPIEETEATFVDTYEGVLEMLEELKKAKEIAVDLEHHDYRTYVGLTSLMQISTREKDWIVDTLKPWREQLQVLNEVFADPQIIKVFHGAYMDIVWLQRDLGLYVNGLFDTFFACEALHYPQKGLAYLLSKFVNFNADKRYQMADWRMRPIPKEMLYYARCDTHYLLYVYDKVRNELVMKSDRGNPATDYIETVLGKSKSLSLSKYEGENFDPASGKGGKGWYGSLLKHPAPFSGQQFAVYRAIWEWRDEVARKEDESTAYVLPNGIVGDIAKRMPPDAKALHALIPNNAYLARRNVTDLWQRYQEARERGVKEPSLYEFFRSDLPSAAAKPVVETAEDQAADAVVTPAPLAVSQLFGGMALSSVWETAKSTANGLGDHIMLPWQKFVDKVATVEAQEDVAMEGGVEDEAKAAAAQSQEPEVEEEFTLKTGTKRKAPSVDIVDGSEDESQSDSSSVNFVMESASKGDKKKKKYLTEEERKARTEARREAKVAKYKEEVAEAQADVEQLEAEMAKGRSYPGQLEEAKEKVAQQQARLDNYLKAIKARKTKSERKAEKAAAKERLKEEKKARKAEKKAKKAEKRAKKSSKQNSSEGEEDEEAFDYTQATSVLHANRSGGAKKVPPKPAFDPYAKTGDDAPKAARKAPPPRGERSATFRK
ncbi:Exosome complex exonuclease rrp6 [Colletotrichum sidae]|uniref:Exosome complex exonuclease rrp6 n=1 Tax=Colletotrichum sidae TaxID=1347389 RepID=A0A4V3I2G9_9PEZI|nr:Exosome complex exonuclease rrp6 [Colletotrichum sidae]